ncbi:hypothetical protein ACX929_24570, partial [Enterobacter roggenkampii]
STDHKYNTGLAIPTPSLGGFLRVAGLTSVLKFWDEGKKVVDKKKKKPRQWRVFYYQVVLM